MRNCARRVTPATECFHEVNERFHNAIYAGWQNSYTPR